MKLQLCFFVKKPSLVILELMDNWCMLTKFLRVIKIDYRHQIIENMISGIVNWLLTAKLKETEPMYNSVNYPFEVLWVKLPAVDIPTPA